MSAEPDPATSARERILDHLNRQGLIRPRELPGLGAHRMTLERLLEAGLVERVSRGLYRLADAEPLQHQDLAVVAARVPKAVIGLVTALDHYGLTTEIPRAVDVLLQRGSAVPRLDHPPIRVFWASPAAFAAGVREIEIDGVATRITGPAKTVADCFKYKRRVGRDVALEALESGLRKREFTPAEFMEMARVDRVAASVRPYVESLT